MSDDLETLTEAEAAAVLRLSPETLAAYRTRKCHAGRGPAFVQRGRGRVLYLRSDLIAWLHSHRRENEAK